MVVNQARYQALSRFFGVSRQNANVFTAILVLTAANVALERTMRTYRTLTGVRPGDAAIGVAAMREGVARVVGPGIADTPLLGTVLTIGIVGGLAAPGVRRAAHALRMAERRIREHRIELYRAAMRAAGADASA